MTHSFLEKSPVIQIRHLENSVEYRSTQSLIERNDNSKFKNLEGILTTQSTHHWMNEQEWTITIKRTISIQSQVM